MLSGKSVHNTTPCHEKRTSRMCAEAILSLILRVFRLPNLFFTKTVSIGTSIRLLVKGVQIPFTLITKYHIPLYLPLFFIQFYFLVGSLASYRGNCFRPLLYLFPSSRFTIHIQYLWPCLRPTGQRERTICATSAQSGCIKYHFISVPIITDHAAVFAKPVKGCAI